MVDEQSITRRGFLLQNPPFNTENEAKHSGFGLLPGTQPGVFQWPQGAFLRGEMVIRRMRLIKRLSAGTDASIYLVCRFLTVHNFGIFHLVRIREHSAPVRARRQRMAPPVTLPTRRLGRNGPEIPAIGFGLMGLSTAYGTVG